MERKISRLLSGMVLLCNVCSNGAIAAYHQNDPQPLITKLSSRFKVFQEPLVPIYVPEKDESQALETVVNAYRAKGDSTDISALSDFLKEHPRNPWRASLLLNMGLVRKQSGFYTEAISLFEQAWRAITLADEPEEKKVSERALAELIYLHHRFGNKAQLSNYLGQLTTSPFDLSSSELIAEAKSGLWQIENTPEEVLTCGLLALDRFIATEAPGHGDRTGILKIKAGKNGVSFAELKEIAVKRGLTAQLVHRDKSTPVPVPSVMHLKVGHYATIVQERGGQYEVFDPTLQETLWFPVDAIEAESSGYFLVSESNYGEKKPWTLLDNTLAQSIFGGGNTSGSQRDQTSCDDVVEPASNCLGQTGMPDYRVHSMLVSLNIIDTPLTYTPPVGPDIPITLSYSQREALQPSTFSFGNLGHKWLFNWLSYIEDDPQVPGSKVRIFLPGGGSRAIRGYDSNTGSFTREQRTGAVLTLKSGAPVQYERELADGRRYLYEQSDGNTFFPRRIFLTEVIDQAGNAVHLSYDSQQRLVSLKDALGQVTQIQYDHPFKPLLITGVTDPFGRFATFDYDGNGRLIGITDAEGMTSTFEYGNGNFMTGMSTPYGSTKFSAGTSGTTRWIEITDPRGDRERVEYRHSASGIPFSDSPVPSGMNLFNRYINSRNTFYWDKEAMHRAPGDYKQARIRHWFHLRSDTSLTTGVLESIKNPLEHRIWFNYPGQSWAGAEGTLDKPSIIGRVLPDGTTQLKRREYNSRGNIIAEIDPLGREVRYVYAANDIDVERVLRQTVNGFETIAEFTYNSQHLPLTYTGPSGQLYSYTYNPAGQITSVTNPIGQVVAYEYDSQGYLLGMIDANGVSVVSYTYDGMGRRESETNASGYRIEYTYDDLNRLVTVRYPDGTSEYFAWEKLDLVSVTDRYGSTTQFTYDEVHNRLSVLDPSGHLSRYEYFRNGRIHSFKDGKSNTTEMERDIQGRLIRTIYPDIDDREFVYDSSGRLVEITDPLGGTTSYGYDKDNKITRISDPAGNTTRYRYDFYTGNLIGQVSPDSGATNFEYDLNNNVVRQTDAMEQSAQFEYDDLNRLKRIEYSDGQSVAYKYDSGHYGEGRLVEIREDQVTTSFAYDESGNVEHQTQSSSDESVLTIEYGYTPSGNVSQVIYPSGAVVDYRYVNDRLSGIIVNGQTVLEHIQYEPFGPIRGWKWGNGESHTRSYDAAGSLTSFDLEHGFRTLSYDSRNNIKGIKDNYASQNFQYDSLDRLTNASSIGEPVGQNYNLRYDYDANGNRIFSEIDGVSEVYTIERGSNRLTDLDGVSRLHDANGNLIDDGRHTYQYDARNRLVKVDNRNTGIYKFNALGQRIYKKGLKRYRLTADINRDGVVNEDDIHLLNELVDAGENPSYADLTIDGTVDQFDVACVATQIDVDENTEIPARCHLGESIGLNFEARFFYQGPNLIGEYTTDGWSAQEIIWMGNIPVALLQENKLYFIHSDQLGSPVVITNSEGDVVWRWDHRPFGDSDANDDPDGDGEELVFNLRFPGQYYDAETGLHYNYFRDYDPTIGRYIQSDPIGLSGSMNIYGYGDENPLLIADFYGLRGERQGGRGEIADFPRGMSDYINDLINFPNPYDEGTCEFDRRELARRVAQLLIDVGAQHSFVREIIYEQIRANPEYIAGRAFANSLIAYTIGRLGLTRLHQGTMSLSTGLIGNYTASLSALTRVIEDYLPSCDCNE